MNQEEIIKQLKAKENELTKYEEQIFQYEIDRINMSILKQEIRELIKQL